MYLLIKNNFLWYPSKNLFSFLYLSILIVFRMSFDKCFYFIYLPDNFLYFLCFYFLVFLLNIFQCIFSFLSPVLNASFLTFQLIFFHTYCLSSNLFPCISKYIFCSFLNLFNTYFLSSNFLFAFFLIRVPTVG